MEVAGAEGTRNVLGLELVDGDDGMWGNAVRDLTAVTTTRNQTYFDIMACVALRSRSCCPPPAVE